MKALLFDTETSGFINKKLAADHPEQAWCIQVGAILADEQEELEHLNLIVQPNGRTCHPMAEKVHGISVEYAEENGLPELEVTEQFGKMMRKADIIVCHNFDFDWQYVRHMMERNIDNLSDEARSAFYLDLPSFCTMKDKAVKKFVGAKNKNNQLKWPKLIELFERVANAYEAKHGEPWEHASFFSDDNAHDAFADISATNKCFWELQKLGIINIEI